MPEEMPLTEEMQTTAAPVEESHEEEGGEHIQLAAEPAFMIGNFSVPNTMIATWLTTLLILVLAVLVRLKAGIVPSRLQVVFEEAFNMFYGQLEDGLGEKRARFIAPLIITFFIFVLISNEFILLPLVNAFVTEHGHFFRTPTTDYSLTIALAIITIGTAHGWALAVSPLQHIGNYIRVKPLWQIITGKRPASELVNAGIEIFLGVLEILGDIIKIISLGTRLFGNIIAGEVVIVVISGLMFATQFLVPIPFILLAAFAGLIQAFVFTLLSTLFISNNIIHATAHHDA